MQNNGWREVMLEDVADELTVGYVGPMASEYVETGIPFLRSQNVEPLRVNQEDIKFITPEFHERIRKSALSPGDVVIVRTGKPGACTVMPDCLPIANCSDLVIVRCGKNLNARFLAYYVNTVATHHVSAHLVGAVQQHFNVSSAKKLKMLLPGIGEQNAIVSVLGALDDKIELNRRMNGTLVTLAQTIFSSLFMDANTKLPTGWKKVPFTETVEILGGGTPKTSVAEYWNGSIPWFSVADAPRDSDVFVIDTVKKITRAGVENSSAQVLPVGTTIISARGTVGKIGLVGVPMAMNQSCYGLRGKADAKGFHTYFATRAIVSTLQRRAHGSVFDTITQDTLAGVQVVTPPVPVVEEFEQKVSPLMERIRSNQFESRTLAELRDALLPKLLSGELRVSDGLNLKQKETN